MLTRLFFPFLLLAFSPGMIAQPTLLSGVINHYAAVIEFDSCAGKLIVSDTTGFRPGVTVLVMQMQGAAISTGNNPLYGVVLAMNFAGRYERAQIETVTGNAVFLKNKLTYSMIPSGKVQLVTLPVFDDAVVTDTLRPQAWNGATGGVVALEVKGTLRLDAPVVADGAGFRGGASYVATGNNCSWLFPEISYSYGLGSWRGGRKGEGIALLLSGQELGRGPLANGGGGGNDHNSGGGGGGNTSSGGSGGANDEPTAFNCDGYFPGIGGYGVFFNANRLFLGGGGGGGHSNNSLNSGGANGGGIIFVKAQTLNGANPLLSANGLPANTADGDGAGGGGGGGAIWLQALHTPPDLQIQANGGKGGNTANNNANRCFGPGGGGSGGRILTNLPGIPPPAGGSPGIVTNSTNGCNGDSNGAEPGQTGEVEPLPDLPEGSIPNAIPAFDVPPSSVTVCAGDSAQFIVQVFGAPVSYRWELNTGTGWAAVTPGQNYLGEQTEILRLTGADTTQNGYLYRCVAIVPGCLELPSNPALLTVLPAANAAFSTSIAGTAVSFSNLSLNAKTYFWDFGDGNNSIDAAPQHAYDSEGAYTVTLYAITDCDTAVATQMLHILLPPLAGFTAPGNISACEAATLNFQNTSTGSNTTYKWLFPGGTPANDTTQNPVITYNNSGTYTATLIVQNAAGADTLTQTFTFNLIPPPAADFSFSATGALVQFTSTGAGATHYWWDFGDGATSSGANPEHLYAEESVFTVVLTAWNDCDTVTSQQIVALQTPPLAAFSVSDTLDACGPVEITFVNLSSPNATEFFWEFPGGVPSTSTQETPVVVYSAAGTYSAQLTASNGAGISVANRSFVIRIFDLPQANFNSATLPGGVIQFDNLSQNGQIYTWDFGDQTSLSPVPNPSHQYGQSGTYTVTLIVANICGAAVYQQNVTVQVSGTATGERPQNESLRIFPIPVDAVLTLDFTGAEARPRQVSLSDMTSRLVLSQTAPFEARTDLNVSHLPAGPYLLHLYFAGGQINRLVLIRH